MPKKEDKCWMNRCGSSGKFDIVNRWAGNAKVYSGLCYHHAVDKVMTMTKDAAGEAEEKYAIKPSIAPEQELTASEADTLGAMITALNNHPGVKKTYSVPEAIGFVRGAQDAMDTTTRSRMAKFFQAVDVLIEAAENPRLAYYKQTTLEEEDTEAIAEAVAQKNDALIKTAVKFERLEKQPKFEKREKEARSSVPEDFKRRLNKEAYEEATSAAPKKQPDTNRTDEKQKVLEALKKKKRYSALVPVQHERHPYCYRCWHLSLPVSNRRFRWCQHYGIGIQATQSIRVCNAFERQPLSEGLAPVFRCSSCKNLHVSDKKCKVLGIVVKNLNENKYGMCPYWCSKFKEPVKFNSSVRPTVRRKDNEVRKAGK